MSQEINGDARSVQAKQHSLLTSSQLIPTLTDLADGTRP